MLLTEILKTLKKWLPYHSLCLCFSVCVSVSVSLMHTCTTSRKDSHHLLDILFGLLATMYLHLNSAYNRNVKFCLLTTSWELHWLLDCAFTDSRIYWSKFWSMLYLSLPSLSHLSSFSACISVHLSFFPLISVPWSPDRKWNIRFVKRISLFKCLEMMG